MAIILVAFLVYAGIVFKRVVSQLFAQEELGQAHLIVFDVVRAFTEDTGHFPESYSELEEFEHLNGWAQYEWPTDSAYFRDFVEPQFAIELSEDGVNQFAPHFDTLPSWAQWHCEGYWELILENCNPESVP